MSEEPGDLVIHVDGQPYRVTSPTMSGAQLKALAHKDAVYQVFMEGAANEPDRLIADHEAIIVRSGQQFYTIPPGNGGSAMDLIEDQFQALHERFPAARFDRRGDGTVLVMIPGFLLPQGWNAQTTEVAFVVPLGYPVARPDTFWTDPDLRLENGGFPANTTLNANYGGPVPRLWFSFHPSTWSPSHDSLLTFVRLIRRRLEDAQ